MNMTHSLNLKRNWWRLPSSILLLVALNSLADYWQSVAGNYSFYLSESFLFSSHWWLYVPFLYLQARAIRRIVDRKSMISFSLLVILPVTLHLFTYPALVWGISAVFHEHTFHYTDVLGYAAPLYALQLIMVYSIPIVWNHFSSVKRLKLQEVSTVAGDIEEAVLPEEKKPVSILFQVKNGQQHSRVEHTDILYFSANHPYVNLHLANRKYLHRETLRSVAERMQEHGFIRVHRSLVVRVAAVTKFRSRLNGDYDLELVDGTTLRLSRSYASSFMEAFRTGHPLTAE